MKKPASKRAPFEKSVWQAHEPRRWTGMNWLRNQISSHSCASPNARAGQVASHLTKRQDQTILASGGTLPLERRVIARARMGVGALSLAGALLLAGCTEMISNEIGITGSPSWNVPMQLEGDWSGRAWPAVDYLVACLQADSYTVETAPRLSVHVRQTTLTGQLLFADGEAYDLIGETGSGASFTGNNIAFADIRRNDRKVGGAAFEPDGTSGRLAVRLYLKRPASQEMCRMPATLGRVR